MATNVHVTNDYNVIASLNAHFQSAISGLSAPLVTGYRFEMVFTESGINPPAFSFAHLDPWLVDTYQGRIVSDTERGADVYALMEISTWVTRSAQSWLGQRRQMNGMVREAYLISPTVIIQDYSTAASPSATRYKVDLRGIEPQTAQPEPGNPDIERSRFLVKYKWTQRT